jgi:HEAT repeat protein
MVPHVARPPNRLRSISAPELDNPGKKAMPDEAIINSLLMKIRYRTGLELSEAIDQAISADCDSNRLVIAIMNRLASDAVILPKTLCNAILKSRSAELFDAIFPRLANDHWSLLSLYRGHFKKEQLEEILCDRLYQIAANDSEPLRRAIVEAMAEVGSASTLPTLMAIAHDLEPSAKVGAAFGAALGPMEGLEASSRHSFHQTVVHAIKEIEARTARHVRP